MCYNTHVHKGEKKADNKRLLVVTDPENKMQLLWQCHSSSTAAHNAVNLTLTRLSSTHYWRGMKADVQRFVSVVIALLRVNVSCVCLIDTALNDECQYAYKQKD